MEIELGINLNIADNLFLDFTLMKATGENGLPNFGVKFHF
jgi:hypothetical protein